MKIYVLIGKTGAGKTTVEREMIKDLNLAKLVSSTSRKIRDKEVNGVDHYYLTKSKMIELRDRGELMECAEYGGELYGVEKKHIKDLKSDAITILEPNGYKEYKKVFKDKVVGIYLYAPNDKRLVRCLSRESAPNYDNITLRFKQDSELFKEIEDSNIIKIDSSEEIGKTMKKLYKQLSL